MKIENFKLKMENLKMRMHFNFQFSIFNFKFSSRPRGFTLVEMIVAVGLFSIVMLVSVTALLSLVDANRKIQALQLVMNNLNIALDGMERQIRMGSNFHCGDSPYITPRDCSSTSDDAANHYTFAFLPFTNVNSGVMWVYSYNPTEKTLYRSTDAGAHFTALTSPEVSIDSLQFYVVGSSRGDEVQPKAVVTIRGTAGDQLKTKTTFHIQMSAVQRLLDL